MRRSYQHGWSPVTDFRLSDHPLLVHYGGLCQRLTRDEAFAADCETRINSIGQLLVKEVVGFWKSLSPEGRSSFDPEDILLECWMELKKRNGKYDPARGNYRTFAARIVRNTFLGLLERARCVKLPANGAGMMRDIDLASPEVAERLLSTARDHSDLDSILIEDDRQLSPVDQLIADEERVDRIGDVAEALDELTVVECLAIGISLEPRTIAEASDIYGMEPSVMRSALRTARVKLRLRRERDPD